MSTIAKPEAAQALQVAKTASQNGGVLYLAGACQTLTVVIEGDATTSGGTIAIEEAFYRQEVDPYYAGTWSNIQTVNASDVSGGKQFVIHANGSFWAVRTRIATDITGGGTVSTWAWGS